MTIWSDSVNSRRSGLESAWEVIIGTDGKPYTLVPLPPAPPLTEDRIREIVREELRSAASLINGMTPTSY